MKKTIAIIGTGIMGRGMALNLAKEGHFVRAYSRSLEKIQDLETISPQIQTFTSIEKATKDSDLTILCLTTDSIVEEAFEKINNTKHILDTGTTSLELTEKMWKKSQERGASFFDCPMTGSKLAAESGEIVFMFGGSQEEAAEFKYFLDACGKKTIYCGRIGNGQKVKIALNMVQAGIYEVLLEGLDLAKWLGLDAKTYYDAIDNSAAKSGISQVKLSRAIQGNFETHFSLKNMYKDILHAMNEANRLGLDLPLCKNLEPIYKKGVDYGFAEEDFLSILKFRQYKLDKNPKS